MDRRAARHALPGHFASRTKQGGMGMKTQCARARPGRGAARGRRLQQARRQRQRRRTPQTAEGPEGGRRPRPSPPASTPNSKFMAAAKAAGLDQTLAGPGPYTVFVPDDAAFDKAPAGTFDSNAGEPRPADRHPDQPDPARHGAGRGHRQGDRQRQGQGRAGDHGRRHADRDQGRRQDRPHRLPRATRRRSPRPTSSSPTASSITSTRC